MRRRHTTKPNLPDNIQGSLAISRAILPHVALFPEFGWPAEQLQTSWGLWRFRLFHWPQDTWQHISWTDMEELVHGDGDDRPSWMGVYESPSYAASVNCITRTLSLSSETLLAHIFRYIQIVQYGMSNFLHSFHWNSHSQRYEEFWSTRKKSIPRGTSDCCRDLTLSITSRMRWI